MKDFHQSWVTSASDDWECLKAILLAKSLKRVITTRTLFIFLSAEVSNPLRELLENEFDRCILITKKQKSIFPNLDFSSVTKLHCLKLSKLKKFTFLDCNCVVLKNADEIFNQEGFRRSILDEGGEAANLKNCFVLTTTPSYAKFEQAEVSKKYKPFALPLAEKSELEEKFGFYLDLQEKVCPLKFVQAKIILFNSTHPLDFILSDSELHNATSKDPDGLLQEIVKFCKNLLFDNKMINDKPTTEDFIKILNKNSVDNGVHLKNVDYLKNSIAIVGMSARFPGSNDLTEFWDILINGRDAISHVPKGRWKDDRTSFSIEGIEDTQAGFLKCPIDEIDGKFFGLSPMEMSYMDPQQRLTLQVLWEVLENSGTNSNAIKNSNTGVFGGWWRNDYKEMLQDGGANEQEFFRTYMGNSLGSMTGRISHVIGATGPSISTESGCSTSIVAVDMACKSLLNEECNLAFAFGVNLLLHPFSVKTMSALIAPDGRSKAFDAKADGFGRAEGCAVLVLKRYSDARRDGDQVHALIRGTAVVQEGPSRSLGTPTVKCESLAMELALKAAGVEPREVSFVETHGTGTPVGDPLEIKAITEVYKKGRTKPLVIGSVKTNIGHTESCSGIAGIIKTVLSLQNETIPPHINFTKLNPDINLHAIPAIIPLKAYEWKSNRNGPPRIAGVSSFGITGTDAHLIIQEAPVDEANQIIYPASKHPREIIKITAKSEEALKDLLNLYKNYLATSTESISAFAYTANTTRPDFNYRVSLSGESRSEFQNKLEKKDYDITCVTSSESPKICFLFTGQGSQYPQMAKGLYDHSLVFKTHFDACADLLEELYQVPLKDVIWGSRTKDLQKIIYSQTSIFCVEYCLFKLYQSWGIKPDFVLGHSLGEFAAAVAAEIITFKDALRLVVERSQLIHSLPEGKMAVINEGFEFVSKLLKKIAINGDDPMLDIAATNSSQQTVVSGSEDAVEKFIQLCINNNPKIKCTILQSTHAFHSKHLDGILKEFKQIASSIKHKPAKCIYVSGCNGKVLIDGINAEYWIHSTREAVQFIDASKTILELGCTHFLEIGPRPILSDFILRNAEDVTLDQIMCFPTLKKLEDNWETTCNTLGKLYASGIKINWDGLHRFSSYKKIQIPNYPFQNKSYWFEDKVEKQISIHPLVGIPFVNASATQIFQNCLKLDRVTYLQDHVLGNTIIFPGAGYMEMSLVSAHSATQCLEGSYNTPTSPVSLENFVIESPLSLNKSESVQMQSTVSLDETGDASTTIYSKCQFDKKSFIWIKHSSSKFFPYAIPWNEDEFFKTDTLEKVKIRCNQRVDVKDFYSRSKSIGLTFGPAFQTVKNGFQNLSEYLFELCLDEKVNTKNYILHPVLIDAMFQGMIIKIHPETKTITVPVSVEKFIWYSAPTTDKCFLYVFKDSDLWKDGLAILYDSNGERIAVAIGITFMETSLVNIMSVLEAQKTSLPPMYENLWKPDRVVGPLEKQLHPSPEFKEQFTLNFKEFVMGLGLTDSYTRFMYEKSNKLYMLYMFKTLYDLNLAKVNVGAILEFENLKQALKILPNYSALFRYILMEIVNEGFLEAVSSVQNNCLQFHICKEFPTSGAINDEIKSMNLELDLLKNLETQCVIKTASVLGDILTGRQSALLILFPDDVTKESLAEVYYNNSALYFSFIAIHNPCLDAVLNCFKKSRDNCTTQTVTRFLEVGAGTGRFTKYFVPRLIDYGVNSCEYTFTDISPIFFAKGETVFKNSGVNVIYKTLNIEEAPTDQGFLPHQYDMVIAVLVIHATTNIKQSIINMRNLLKPGGLMLLLELTKPLRSINLFFGALEQFWSFTDFDLRHNNCEISSDTWESIIKESGFAVSNSFETYMDHGAAIIGRATQSNNLCIPQTISQSSKTRKTWIIFSNQEKYSSYFKTQLISINSEVIILKQVEHCNKLNMDHEAVLSDSFKDINQCLNIILKKFNSIFGIIYLWALEDEENISNHQQMCEPFLNLCKVLENIDVSQFIVYSRGHVAVGDHSLSLPILNSIIGISKAFQNEHPTIICRCVDLDPKPTLQNALLEGYLEIFKDDMEFQVAYRNNQRFKLRAKLEKLAPRNKSLSFPKSEYFQLIIPPTNLISDLRYGSTTEIPIGDKCVQILVKSYSLNFRDLFAVLKPTVEFEAFNTVGLDFSGIVIARGDKAKKFLLGDAVYGLNLKGDALPSHITELEELLLPMPTFMTFSEAATLPTVTITVIKCFINIANLKTNETVLIHTGSGGVGLCAIQIAKLFKCKIVATAGSTRKRAYLKTLGLEHIFNSRSTDFEKDIRYALNGNNVDVVLNSLTGPGFKEASLAVCKSGARFIEMSKLNIWTEDEVKKLRPDIFYNVVDLSDAEPSELMEIMNELQKCIKQYKIKPLPFIRFDASDVRQAMTYMQKAKHIGKIILEMPVAASCGKAVGTFKTLLFNDRSTYIVTGGLGGIGMEIVSWMTQSGAKHIVLVGRNLPNLAAQERIDKINEAGANLVMMQYDIGHLSQCETLLEEIKMLGLPLLRGVMHCAGVISDGTFEAQTWEKYATAFHPKANGGWNLHLLTSDYPLEHFVMFSSVSSVFGSLAQSNHVAANIFLDALAEYRHSIGLPATTINWGQWGQVGVAANLEVIGIKPMTTLQCISAIEKIMKSNTLQTAVMEGNISVFKKMFIGCKNYLGDIKSEGPAGTEEVQFKKDEFWKDFDSAGSIEEKQDVVTKQLTIMIKNMLRVEQNELVDKDANFQDLGMDSLMMIEMKNMLQIVVGVKAKITMNSVKDCVTIAQLSLRVVQLVLNSVNKLD